MIGKTVVETVFINHCTKQEIMQTSTELREKHGRNIVVLQSKKYYTNPLEEICSKQLS
jgi:hypothetical protein